MNRAAIAIPEKLFFKIGEVCELTGVQAHVLRYWESEFPMLAPQKNRAGQRVYRKRDVEMALRIRELLYDDQYTIAGAKKKLASELRAGSKLKVVTPEMTAAAQTSSHTTAQAVQSDSAEARSGQSSSAMESASITDDQRASLRRLVSELQELLSIINSGDASIQKSIKK